MGSTCFRPSKQHNQPVYISSINNAMDEAKKILIQKKLQKQQLIEYIIKNQNRKGHLRRLFDHLNSHKKNILPAINECIRRTGYQKSYSSVIISNLFCEYLVKMLLNKKQKSSTFKTQNNLIISTASTRNLVESEYSFRNILHQLQSHFFQLVTKILVYGNKQKKIQNNISQIIIQYSRTCEQKISAKKQLKNVLDLYLSMVFEKDIKLIDRKTFIPFYAYSTLIQKSRSELFTADFIQKHFSFILKLFFQLQDTKSLTSTLVFTQDFDLFQQSIESIIKQFILISTQNKKIKQHILNEIMLEQDNQKFQYKKTSKLEFIIKDTLSNYNREHFMFDWLGYLVKYIAIKSQNQNQSIRDSIMDSLQQIQNVVSQYVMKNLNTSQAKCNSIQTLKRWFQQQLLNVQKTLQYFSTKIFQSLMCNLYNSQGFNQQFVAIKSKQVINYLLGLKPNKLPQILLILNKQLRKNKHQYFASEAHIGSHNIRLGQNNSRKYSGNDLLKKRLVLVEQQTIQGLWQNSVKFILQEITIKDNQIKLTSDQIQLIYHPLLKVSRPSINLLYLIELSGIGLKYIDLQNQNIQRDVYNYIISIASCLKIEQSQIDYDYIKKFNQKNKYFINQLGNKNQAILYSYLKYSFKNIFKQTKLHQLWIQILIIVILINIFIQNKKSNKPNKPTDKLKKLQLFLQQIVEKIRTNNHHPQQIYKLYQQNKHLFDLTQRISAHFQKIKLKTLQQFQLNLINQSPQKSISNIQQSVIQSKFDYSQSNPDSDFKNMYKMVVKQ